MVAERSLGLDLPAATQIYPPILLARCGQDLARCGQATSYLRTLNKVNKVLPFVQVRLFLPSSSLRGQGNKEGPAQDTFFSFLNLAQALKIVNIEVGPSSSGGPLD